MWTAAILAGGSGRRLGGVDKSALTIGDRTILAHQLSLLTHLTEQILIVTTDPARFAGLPVRVVQDRLPGSGPLGALQTALHEARGDRVLVTACDMPFLTIPFLTHLLTAGEGADATVPRDARGRHPLCASYAIRVSASVDRAFAAGERSVRAVLDGLRVHEVHGEELAAFGDDRLLTNINTPEDYTAARAAWPAGCAVDCAR